MSASALAAMPTKHVIILCENPISIFHIVVSALFQFAGFGKYLPLYAQYFGINLFEAIRAKATPGGMS